MRAWGLLFPRCMNREKITRCVNIDWLEVHAKEATDRPRDHFYYRAAGYNVKVREYGTRVYREMFTILGNFDEPLLEVRRDPASQGITGIHEFNECHIRLCNRTCYFDNAADFLAGFLEQHGYYNVRISRIDLCLDFVQFDLGDKPEAFVRRYFKHKYAKINQGRIRAHGEDTWSGQDWNSLAWGSKTSAVTTKLYNKTLELYDAKLDRFAKPYIREAWLRSGFIDDMQYVTLKGERINVWRLEFSIFSAVKNWVKIEIDGDPRKPQSLQNTLKTYNSRDKILIMFASLARHYFRFKKYEEGKRKDRCEDKVLFNFDAVQDTYKIGRNDYAAGSGNSFKSKFERLIEKIRAFQITRSELEVTKACEVIIAAITEDGVRSDLECPWSNEELEFMKKLIFVRTAHPDLSYDIAVDEVKKLLNINKQTWGG